MRVLAERPPRCESVDAEEQQPASQGQRWRQPRRVRRVGGDDTERNMFFLNMEGMSLATLDDIESIGAEIDKRLAAIGKKVQVVVNYDNFYLAPDLTDAYVTLVRRLAEHYYAAVTRYTTSSFMRLKLSEQLSNRGLAPHIYESRQEATNWNKK